jgi:hypothetical protein
MANLQSTCIIGTFTVGTTCTTSAPGYIWFNSSTCQLEYSRCSGGSVIVCTP